MKYDFKSKEELIFAEWLSEAKDNKLVEDWSYEEKTFELISSKSFLEVVELKTKSKILKRSLHASSSYTPDFKVILTELGMTTFKDVFKKAILSSKGSRIIYIDTKGEYDRRQGDGRFFSLVRKVLYDKHGIWVEKVVPKKIFPKTYAPKQVIWMKNRKSPTKTKLGGQCMTIDEYLTEKK